jgi:hypothetical protein
MTEKELEALLQLVLDVKNLKLENCALCGAVILLGLLIAAHMLGGI